MSAQAIRAGRAFIELVTEDRKLVRGLNNAQGYVRSFVAVVGKDLSKMAADAGRQVDKMAQKLDSLGNKLSSRGGSAIRGGLTIAAPLALASKMFADYSDQVSAVAAVTGSSAAEMQMLDETAQRLGRTTSFTAVQVALLMTELGRAGFTATQVQAMTGAVLDLSRATGTDSTLSSGIMAATIRQFGLAATDATRVADALTVAANKSFNTVEALGEALSYAGPVAADFNMSLEDTLAILGALGNVGIQGSNAGTAVRRLLTINAAEAERMKQIFGVEFADAAGNARPLVDTLAEVAEATKDLGTAARAQKFNEAFGLLGITGASAIAKNAVSVRDLQQALQNAGGTAERTAKMMDDNLGGTIRILLSAFEGLAIAIGEAMQKKLRSVGEWITVNTEATARWVKANGTMIVTVAKLAAGVLLLGVGLKVAAAVLATFVGATQLAIGAVKLLGATLTFISAHPIIAGIAAISVALLALSGAFDSADSAVDHWIDGARKAREEGDKVRAEHVQMFERLKQLAAMQNRSAHEQAEANSIVKTLTRSYGNMGIEVDRLTGKIDGLSEAERDMLAQQKKSRIHQLQQEADGLKRREQNTLRAGLKIGTGLGVFDLGELGWGSTNAEEHTQLLDEANELRREYLAIEEEIANLQNGTAEAAAQATAARQKENAILERNAELLKQQEATSQQLGESIEDAQARLSLEGPELDRRLLDLAQLREREQLGETADPQLLAQKQDLDRQLLEQSIARSADQETRREADAVKAAERELVEAIAETDARLNLQGLALERRLLEIRQERERQELAPGVDRGLLDMKQRAEALLLNRQGLSDRVYESRGTISGTAAARGYLDAGGPADDVVQRLDRLIALNGALIKAVQEAAPKALP